jgi:biotin carboxyl carrier protein
MIYQVTVGGVTHKVELTRGPSGWQCKLDGRELPLDVSSTQDGVLSLLIAGKSYEVKLENGASDTSVIVGQERFATVVRDPRSLRSRRPAETGAEGIKKVTASMPGKVLRILAAPGTAVEAGQGVLVIEAMKMQNEMKSPKSGTVKKIYASEGAAVEAGQVLAEIE